MNTIRLVFEQKKVDSDYWVFTVAAIMAFFCFSLLLYAIPILVNSMAIRAVTLDSGFLLLSALSWRYLNCKLSHLLSQTASVCIVIGIGMFGFTAFLQGAFNEKDILLVLKDFRIFVYFFVTLIVWSSILSSPASASAMQKTRLLIVLFVFSLLGTITYIILGNYMFAGASYAVSDRYALISSQSDEILDSFARAAAGKYQSTPFVLAFAQCMGLSYYLKEKRLSYIVYSLLLLSLCVSVALLSNMRALMLAWIIGTFVAIFFTFLKPSSFKNHTILLKLIIPAAMGVFMLPAMFYFLNENWTGFDNQIVDKGAYTESESMRLNSLIDVLSFSDFENFGLFGMGMGGHFYIDSAFKNIAGEFGYIFLMVYIALMGISLIAGWKKCIRDVKLSRGLNFSPMSVSIFSGLLSLVINNYNHSHFLFIPDAVFAGLIFGYCISSGRLEKSLKM